MFTTFHLFWNYTELACCIISLLWELSHIIYYYNNIILYFPCTDLSLSVVLLDVDLWPYSSFTLFYRRFFCPCSFFYRKKKPCLTSAQDRKGLTPVVVACNMKPFLVLSVLSSLVTLNFIRHNDFRTENLIVNMYNTYTAFIA